MTIELLKVTTTAVKKLNTASLGEQTRANRSVLRQLNADVFTKIPSTKNIPDPDIYYFKTSDPFLLDLPDEKKLKPFYYISKLWSTGKGSGTKGIKEVVSKSIADKETGGRVFLDAACLDHKTSPAGFYYKLGFRFKDKNQNAVLKDWLKRGGKVGDAPMECGIMYLPKRNIKHCLTYG